MNVKQILAILVTSSIILGTTGCAKKVTATTPFTVTTPQQKLAKANDILATSVNSAVQITTSLGTSGVLTPAQTEEALNYEQSLAAFSNSLAAILKSSATWQQQIPQIALLVTTIPSQTLIAKYTGLNNVQYAGLIAAIQGLTSAVQIVIIEVQQ